jgi:hypothetical protein
VPLVRIQFGVPKKRTYPVGDAFSFFVAATPVTQNPQKLPLAAILLLCAQRKEGFESSSVYQKGIATPRGGDSFFISRTGLGKAVPRDVFREAGNSPRVER